MDKFKLKNSLLLLLTAVIWGTTFVAQSVGNEYIGPFTFDCTRSIIGGASLLPVIAIMDATRKRKGVQSKYDKKTLIVGGLLCGIALFFGEIFQQTGLLYTTTGKAGFITALYIVFVPVAGIFFKRKAGARVWIAVGIAVVGLYFLCMTGGEFSFGTGEVLLLLCAIAYTFQILLVGYFSPLADGVKLACIEFFVCGVISSIGLIWEKPQMSDLILAWAPILYAGFLSCGVAYTLQIIAQKDLNPTVASLIMCMESVVSVIAGWLILGQKMSGREIFGCVLMFMAIVLVQLPGKVADNENITERNEER